jgi:hypothetical protein
VGRTCALLSLTAVATAALVLSWSFPVLAAQSPGRGPVRVQSVALASSFLERATYDATSQTLTIVFDDGSTYVYANVPPETFAALQARAQKPDAFFRESVRKSFPYVRLRGRSQRSNSSEPASGSIPGFNCPSLTSLKRQDVVSGALSSVAYDPATSCLVISFRRGGTYGYSDVPAEVYQRLVQTGTEPGKYFNSDIRDKYKTRKLAMQ